MNEKIIVQLSEILLSAAAIIGIAIILAATWYDLRAIAQKKLLQNIMAKLNKSRQPSITILIYAHNDAATIIDCMRSINANPYENYKTIICNNASTDATEQLIADYIRRHKEMPLIAFTKNKFVSRSSTLHQAYQKARKNDLVLILNATDVISPNLLKESTVWFVVNKDLTALRLRLFNMVERNIATLPLRFIELSKNTIRKAMPRYTVLKKNYEDSGVMIRSSAFEEDVFPKNTHVSYASAISFASPRRNCASLLYHSRKRIMFVKIITSLLIILMLSYFSYTAAILQSNTLLTLSWLLVVLWFASVIWSDEIIPRSTKFELTATLPFIYFVFYVFLILHSCKMIIKSIGAIPLPRLSFKNLHDAVQVELYSTRY